MPSQALRILVLLALSLLCLSGTHAAPPTPPGEGDNKLVAAVNIEGFEHVSIYSVVSGYLEKQEVDIGTRVKKGDILAVIDSTRQQHELEMRRGHLEEAEAGLEEAKQEVEDVQSSVEQARLHVRLAGLVLEQARLRLARAEADCTRLEENKGNETRERLRQAQVEREDQRLAVKQAELEVKETELKVAAALRQVKRMERRVFAAMAQVKAARAAVAAAQAELAFCTLRAPLDGVVTDRSLFPGDYVREGDRAQTPLLKVERTDKMRAVFSVPDRFVPYLKVGQRVSISVDALPNRVFKGRIARMGEAIDDRTRALRAEVDLSNPEALIHPGMYGTVRLELDRAEDSKVKDR